MQAGGRWNLQWSDSLTEFMRLLLYYRPNTVVINRGNYIYSSDIWIMNNWVYLVLSK